MFTTKQYLLIWIFIHLLPRWLRDWFSLFRTTISLAYYGLTLSTGRLAGDLFLNTFFLSLTEVVGNLSPGFILATSLGRAGSMSLSMLLSGALLLASVPLTAGKCRQMSTVLACLAGLYRSDFRFAPSQWETALLCNDVSRWLGANLESALLYIIVILHEHYGASNHQHLDRFFNCLVRLTTNQTKTFKFRNTGPLLWESAYSGKSAVYGTRAFKEKGALFQEKFYPSGIFMPSQTSWRYDCKWMASIWM